tara:strand:- start:7410 stop:7877 length:468 start_codon:yes stop_codon:yes gene_type:complete
MFMSNLFKANLYLKAFGFFRIPLIFYINPKIISLTDEEIKVAIKLNRRTRNHYGSMYFGALAVGADISVGLFAMALVKKSGANMGLLFKDFEIQFHKRAEGETIFICHEHEKINNQIASVLRSGKRVNEKVTGKAFVPSASQDPVCSFNLTISLK